MKRKLYDWLSYILVIATILALAAVGIWWEWGMWSECLTGNSFWYCWRVLS